MYNIDEFKHVFLPDVEQIKFTQLDLDISDLGIADILRNTDSIYPKGGRERSLIESGKLGIIIKCKSELLEPMEGLIIVITNDQTTNIVSKNYIVAIVSEDSISTIEGIIDTLKDFTKYIIKEFKDSLQDFGSFYIKYIYDIDVDTQDEEDSIFSHI